MPRSEVYNCDCLEYMKGLPDKCFSLAVADPPYGINAANMANTQSMRNRLQSGAGKLKDRILQIEKKDWDWNYLEDSPIRCKVLSPEEVAEFRKWAEKNMQITK